MKKIFSHLKIKLSYTDIGEGNAVVLLHGFGEDENIWKHQVAFLQKKYRVIVPNLPGTQTSEMLQQQNVSIDDYAICIQHLVENILPNSHQKITLLGHSMGGYITLSYVKLFPKKLNAFGLIHSTSYADSDEKRQVRLRGIEIMEQYGAYSFLKNTTPNLFSNSFKENHWQHIEALIENSKTTAFIVLQQYYVAMMNRKDATNILQDTNLPVLFIMGTEDVAVPLNDVLQQCHLPKQSHIRILENVGHIGMLETPEEINISISKFLNNLSL